MTDGLSEIYKPIAEDLKNVDRRLMDVVASALDPFPREFGAFRSLGKRMRPAVTLMVYRLASRSDSAGVPPAVIEQAVAVELMHIATLIHDDVVDGSYQRRGHQTLHKLFTDKTAVLVGDYLYATAIDMFNRNGTHHAVDIVTRTTVGMAHGELMQVLLTPETRSRREIYLDIISKKTADFFATSAEVGAEAARVVPEKRDLLRKFGWNFGMAFQMIDDVLDYTASADSIGKPVFQDLAEGKMTLPAILLIESGAEQELMETVSAGRLTPESQSALIEQIARHDVVARSIREADQYLAEAREILNALPEPGHPAQASLLALCDYILFQKGMPQPSLTR